MNYYLLVKYLHFVSVFAMLSFLVAELALVRTSMKRGEIAKISKLDGLYGLMAVIMVAAGLILWFGVGKPSSFYTANLLFHIKVGLAVLVGLISIVPTVFFLKNRKGNQDEEVSIPPRIKGLIILQLVIIGLIPLLAVLMANGVQSII
jgi:putative membrane protein